MAANAQQGGDRKVRRVTPREKRIADRALGEERRRAREERDDAQRARQQKINGSSAWNAEYAANRRLKRAMKRADKATRQLEKSQAVLMGGHITTTARELERVQVPSPTVQGGVEFVWKPVDAVKKLVEAKKIGKTQQRVALKFKAAFDRVTGSIGGVMDFDRVRGGGSTGRTPSPYELDAADTLSQFDRILGAQDAEIVSMVVGYGHSVEECAAHQFGLSERTGRPSVKNRDYIEQRLIDALSAVAAVWYPPPKAKGRA